MPTVSTMRWLSALSTAPDAQTAVEDCILRLKASLNGVQPDLLTIFISAEHKADYERVANRLREALVPRHFLGCTAAAVIGEGKEVEDAPGLAVSAAILPGVTLHPVHISDANLPDPDQSPRAWEQLLGVKAEDAPSFVLLLDPYSIRAEDLLAGLDFAFPNAAKVGGLASAGRSPNQNSLFIDEAVFHEGAVVLAFTGNVRVDTLVAQGCRPIGPQYKVTACQRTVLLELDKRKPLEIVAELFENADADDRALIRSALFLGISMDPFREAPPQPGEFLIRNLLGMDPARGALAIGAHLREGQTVQFHVRDKAAAAQDLTTLLRRYATNLLKEGHGETLPASPVGALLFSCLGRGKHMYGRADHDTEAFRICVGDLPLSGFFCNGEIGPVGGTTHLHGFTSSFGIFRAKN